MNGIINYRHIIITLITLLSLSACGGSSSSSGGVIAVVPGPDNVAATPGDERINVTWDSVTDATSYNVYWSTTQGTGTGGTMVNVTTPAFYHNGATNGLAYYYVVTAIIATDETSASDEAMATPADILLSSLFFSDANMEACVDALGLTFVHEVTSLNCSSSSIADITGIEALTSLTSLTLSGNSITDVSPLAGLTSLTTLDLGFNTLTDVSPLAGLTGLAWLRLNSNSITDVSPLASLTSLTTLFLPNNTLTDVSPLAGLTSLTTLVLSNNSIGGQGVGNVDSLTTLISATSISLANNIGMSCAELGTLIDTRGSPPVDTDYDTGTADTATNGVNCTDP